MKGKLFFICRNGRSCDSPIPRHVEEMTVSIDDTQTHASYALCADTSECSGTDTDTHTSNVSKPNKARYVNVPYENDQQNTDANETFTGHRFMNTHRQEEESRPNSSDELVHPIATHTSLETVANTENPNAGSNVGLSNGGETIPSIKPRLAVKPYTTAGVRSHYLTAGPWGTRNHAPEPSEEENAEEAHPPLHIRQISDQYLTLMTSDRHVYHLYYNAYPTRTIGNQNNTDMNTPYHFDLPGMHVSVGRQQSVVFDAHTRSQGLTRNVSTVPATIQLDNGIYLTITPKRSPTRPLSVSSEENYHGLIILPSNPETLRRPPPMEPPDEEQEPSLNLHIDENELSMPTAEPPRDHDTNDSSVIYPQSQDGRMSASSESNEQPTISPQTFSNTSGHTETHFESLRDVQQPINTLSIQQLADCMHLLNMPHHAPTFQSQQIDGSLANHLNDDILIKEFSFTRFEALKFVQFVKHGWRPKKN